MKTEIFEMFIFFSYRVNIYTDEWLLYGINKLSIKTSYVLIYDHVLRVSNISTGFLCFSGIQLEPQKT